MWNIFSSLFSPGQYIPHGHCYLWQTPLVSLHLISNALIAIAYFSIPTMLIYFVFKRKDVPFLGIFALFGAFIILCGVGHLLDIWTLWHPTYWVSGVERALTALVSCITALQMVTLLPQFLALKTPAQLEAVNRELQQEIIERQRTEAERNLAYAELEFRVQERTADLEQANIALRQSEAHFQRLVTNVPGMFYQYKLSPDGSSSFPYISDACRKLYELEPAEMATGYLEAIHLEDQSKRHAAMARSQQTLQSIECEWRITTRSGTEKWIRAVSQPRREADGSTIWDGFQMDVSDRKRAYAERARAEAELQKERECLKAILENLTDGIAACDATGTLMLFNQATRKFHGLPEAILPAEDWAEHFDLYLGDGKTPMRTQDIPLFRAFQGEIIRDVEMVIAPKQGTTRTLLANGQAFFDAEGNRLGAVVAMHDISDRKRAEEERKQAEQGRERLLAILEATTDMVAMSNTSRQILYMNQSGRSMLGLPKEGTLGDRKLTQNYPAWVNEILLNQAIPEAMRSGIWIGETALLGADGNEIPLSQMILSHKNASGDVEYLSTIARDITAQKQSEATLQAAFRETEHQALLLRTVLDSTQDWVFAKDQNFRYILVNRSYAEALEKPIGAILGQDDLELGYPEELVLGNPAQGIRGFRTDDQTALAGESVQNAYDPVMIGDGSLRILDTRKTPLYNAEGDVIAVLGFSHDITDRHYTEAALRRSETQLQEKAEELETTLRELRRTQTQMIQAEKMSGLGQLVAGIAHEINNPVNFIHGNLTPAWDYTQDILTLLDLYQTHTPNPNRDIQAFIQDVDLEFIKDDLPKLLASMQVGTERIREIVLSLRNFSRLDEAEMKTVNLHEGIDNTLVILGNRLKGKSRQFAIEVVKHYDNLPLVECYPGQLNQVFMNVLSNAIEALEESFVIQSSSLDAGNQQTINRHGQLATPTITIHTQVCSAHQIKIRIADNGAGIPTEVQQKMFDPFFTTKPVGKGTGMGLAICYQIVVDKHQGNLEVNSAPGQGTELVITLPTQALNLT